MEKQLPKHWIELSLENLLIIFESGSRPKGGVRSIKTGIPSLGGEHLNYNRTFNTKNTKYVPESFAMQMTKGHIKEGDILIVKDGATTGKTCFVDNKFPFDKAVVNEHLFLCRVGSHITPKYIFWYLWSELGQQKILANFSGIAIGGINKMFASKVFLPIPPIEEQRQIAHTLDDFFTQLDYFRKRLDAIPIALKRYKKLVLEKAVSGELTKELKKDANKWESKNGEELFSFVTSGSRGWAKYYDTKGAIFIRITNLNYETDLIDISAKKIKHVFLPKNVEGKRTRVKANDILISITADIGMIGLVPVDFPEAYINQHIALVRLNKNILSKYIAIFLRSPIGQKQLKEKQTGVVKAGLTLQDIKSLTIPIPSIQEQQEIVKKVEKLLKKANKVEKYYQNAKEFLKKSSKIVLEKAFRGELVSPLDSDIPVEELLDQIKKEKATIEAQRKIAHKNRIREPKPPKMTKEALKDIIKEKFPKSEFNFNTLIEVLENQVQYDYDELRNSLFDLLLPPIKNEDDGVFLEAKFDDEFKFKMK